MPRSYQRPIGVLFSLLLMLGCHTPLAVKQIQAKNPLAKNSAKTPVDIVEVWNSSAQTTPEGKTMRGMAGRIHFYNNQKKSRAVKVDGDLTLYVFDGNETDPAHTKPLKVFQFKSEILDQYYSYQKPFGHGYSFFLPMDEIGGDEKPISIIARFDNKLEATYAISQQPTNTILAGRKPQTPATPTIREFLESRSLLAEANQSISTAFDSSAVQQANYITEQKESGSNKSNVSTIALNYDMTRRLIEGVNESREQRSPNSEK